MDTPEHVRLAIERHRKRVDEYPKTITLSKARMMSSNSIKVGDRLDVKLYGPFMAMEHPMDMRAEYTVTQLVVPDPET